MTCTVGNPASTSIFWGFEKWRAGQSCLLRGVFMDQEGVTALLNSGYSRHGGKGESGGWWRGAGRKFGTRPSELLGNKRVSFPASALCRSRAIKHEGVQPVRRRLWALERFSLHVFTKRRREATAARQSSRQPWTSETSVYVLADSQDVQLLLASPLIETQHTFKPCSAFRTWFKRSNRKSCELGSWYSRSRVPNSVLLRIPTELGRYCRVPIHVK